MSAQTSCTSCNRCQGCNSCQGCNTCEGCNSCQSCNISCNGASCNTKQSFCKIDCQVYDEYGSFKFSYRPIAKTGIMGPGYFDQDVWDEIISYINRRISMGDEVDSGSTIAYSSTSNVAPFKASEFNRISKKTRNGPSVNAGDVIYGSYFIDLEEAVNNTRLSSSACDTCNAGCNAPSCESCETCDGCETCVTGCYTRNSCGTCQRCQRSNTTTTCCGCNTSCESNQTSGNK